MFFVEMSLVVEVVTGKEEVNMVEREVNIIEEEEERAVLISAEIELVEDKQCRELVLFENNEKNWEQGL